MNKVRKDAFLILRVIIAFKERVEKTATLLGESVSEFVRIAIEDRLKKNKQ